VPTFAPGLEGAPERNFVSPGQPAFDCCPQLTVNATPISDAPLAPGGLAAGRKIGGSINHVGLTISITRCQPQTADTPPADSLQAVAEQTNADVWALWNHLQSLWRSGDLFKLCGEVFWDGARAIQPSGGCVGWTLGIRVSLDGYTD